MKMRSNWYTHTSLMGMQDTVASLENKAVISYQVKHTIQQSHVQVCTQEKKNTYLHTDMFANVHGSFMGTFAVTEIFEILIMVEFTQVDAFAKFYLPVNQTKMNFTVGKLYLNEYDF